MRLCKYYPKNMCNLKKSLALCLSGDMNLFLKFTDFTQILLRLKKYKCFGTYLHLTFLSWNKQLELSEELVIGE